ncbi:MAG TPA: hypothetical protein VH000_08325 [Rhizomicrobium sp.]|jgi:hypothetical protein|nr:hypothetical protein [Rhizomicrobium sp.]
MSGWKDAVARRPLLCALGAAIGLVAVGGVAFEAVHRPAAHVGGPYGDLLSALPDLPAASVLGKAMLAAAPGIPLPNASALRKELTGASLTAILASDLLGAKLADAAGWVVPETLAELCVLAAKNG